MNAILFAFCGLSLMSLPFCMMAAYGQRAPGTLWPHDVVAVYAFVMLPGITGLLLLVLALGETMPTRPAAPCIGVER